MNYPPYDPNDPHAQPTTAGQYPTFNQQPGQPPPQFPANPGQYSQNGQNFPPYPGQYPQNTQPGQFGPPPIQPQQKWYRKTAGIILWLILIFPVGIYLMWRYARWDRKAKWAVTGFFAVYTLFSLIIVSAASGTASQRSTSVQSSTQVASVNPTDTPIPSPTPTPTPSPTTQPVPTKPQVQQSVQQQPVQQAPPPPAPAPPTPAPPPPATGVNGNPWGYNFTPGNYIYSPVSNFCTAGYFSCIANFSNGKGYVEECSDGMYSKSGGRSGSCSDHGGDKQPLYSH